jgi:hypothetical protein
VEIWVWVFVLRQKTGVFDGYEAHFPAYTAKSKISGVIKAASGQIESI